MNTIHLFERKTSKYRDGWSHMDRHDFLGTVKLTAGRVIEPGNYHDVGPTTRHTMRVPAGLDAQRVAKALRDTIGGSNCRHEYDCCGCASRHVFTRLVATRRLSVTISVGYNY